MCRGSQLVPLLSVAGAVYAIPWCIFCNSYEPRQESDRKRYSPPIRPTVKLQVISIPVTAAISLLFANLASADFLANFTDFPPLVLYFFIPWTAVNLTDYFITRKAHYAIAEIFNPTGIYRGWGWPEITAYLVGFLVMIPVFSAGTLFVGPAAHAMGSADISLFIGLPVAAMLYWILTRRIDTASGIALAREQGDHTGRSSSSPRRTLTYKSGQLRLQMTASRFGGITAG